MEDKNKETDIHLKFQNDVMKLSDMIYHVNNFAQELYFRSTNSELYRSDDGKEIISNLSYQFGVVTCHNNDLRVVISELLGHVTPNIRANIVERLKSLEEEFARRTGNKA